MTVKQFRTRLGELAKQDLEESKEFFDSEFPRLVRELKITYDLQGYIKVKKIGQNFLEFYAEITETNS